MSTVVIKGLVCDTSTNKFCLFERHNPSPRTNNIILIKIPEHAAQPQGACGLKCLYSAEEFSPMWSPHRWTVSVGCPSLGHTESAQCSIGPVALSSCTVQIQVKLSVQLLQYHGLTASH